MYVDDDLSSIEIAEVIGVHPTTIADWLKAMGVPMRPRSRSGEKNGRYKDGTESRAYEKLVTKRRCARCPATTKLLVHHKDGDHQNNDPDNLEVLCGTCHTRLHKLAYWAAQPKKTTCKHGHPLEDNVHVNKKGHRYCKICKRAAGRKSDAKRDGRPDRARRLRRADARDP
jgi:hypothetical protein